MPDSLTELGENRIIGPPGTGKTTRLARQIEHDAQQRGSEAVIALSHTNAAAVEISQRDVPLPRANVGTLHHFAYAALGRPPLLETAVGLADFNEEHPGFKLTGGVNPEELEVRERSQQEPGDGYMQDYQRLRNLMVPREAWPSDVVGFAAAWEDYKAQAGGIDFTDMVSQALEETTSAPGEPEVIVADECQDCSRLQMHLLWKWARAAQKVVMCLDADQTLYAFSGSDPRVFLENQPKAQHVLAQSYRLPRQVHAWATAWIAKNKQREPITYKPRDAEGSVTRSPVIYKLPEHLLPALERDLNEEKTVMVLASCGYMLEPLVQCLRSAGIPFHNPYRKGEGGRQWNPLARRKNSQSAAQRLATFMLLWRPDDQQRMWTGEECQAWLGLLQGVLKRGAKIPATLGEAVTLDQLLPLFASEEDFKQMYQWPPGCLYWIREHLAKRFAKSGQYAVQIALRSGVGGLEETPKICVGTIHSVKGGEAEAVYLWPDLSLQGFEGWATEQGREAIRRLFYVGATRTKSDLHLMAPSTPLAVAW
jgi:DNA helicase II / ATP-dependent DNA helicase PcrA